MPRQTHSPTDHTARGRRLRGALRAPIAWILLAFVILGATYLVNIPPFETPDEYGHYAYVRFLAEERRLPPLVISDHEWIQGQMHQPPLYYALGALLAGTLDKSAWQASFPRNPLARLGDPDTPVHRNAVIHPGSPTEASRRVVAALRVLRGFSLLCSAVAIALTYLTVRVIAPGERWLAAGTAAAMAFNPQFLFISASANNDVLVTALCAAALYLSARVARSGIRSSGTPLALGVLVGLAALSKLSGLATLVLPGAAFLLSYLAQPERHPWRDLARPLLLTGAAAGIVSGGWFLRNALAYADPLGMQSYASIFAVHAEPLSIATSLRIMREALPSYWGVFGWLNVLMPALYYRAVDVLSLAAIGGLALWGTRAVARRRLLERPGVRAAVIAGLWALVIVVLLLSWTRTITRTQGRLAFPAAGVFALALVAGLTGPLPRRLRPAAASLLGGALLLLAAVVPWWVIAPAYPLAVTISPAQLPRDLQPVNVRFGQDLRLIAAEIVSPEAVAGDYLWVRLYWQAERPMDVAYTVALQLAGAQGERLGGIDTQHAMGRYPSNTWAVDEITVDDVIAPVERAPQSPVAAAVRVAVYDERPERPLPAFDGAGTPLGTLADIGRVRMYPEGLSFPAPERTLSHDLAGMRLVGYDLAVAAAPAGARLSLALHWLGLARMDQAYTIFVHLVDGEGNLVAQADAPPMDGHYDTLYWWPGDCVRSLSTLEVPASALAEPLTLRLGIYLPDSGVRVMPAGTNGRDYIEIGPFSIRSTGAALRLEGG